jgi:hypothetical protein
MAVGMVDMENVKLLFTKIPGEIGYVTQMRREKPRMIKLHRMVQLKSIRGLDSRLQDPFFNTILRREGGFPVGKGDIMPSLLQSFAEAHRWISGTRPLPVAEKMENLHPAFSPIIPLPLPETVSVYGKAAEILKKGTDRRVRKL